jgi:uncharacterized protein YukE
MLIKAKYENIDSIGDYLVEEASEFNRKIEDMISKLENLELYWSGPDYENFKKVYGTYLRNLKTTYIELNAFGNALRKVSYYFGEVDVDFGLRMRKMGNQNEELDKQ